MRTQLIKLPDGKYRVAYRRHFWSKWYQVNMRFLSRKNAVEYAKRLEWKFKHPRKYRKMLAKHGREYFTGHGGDSANA